METRRSFPYAPYIMYMIEHVTQKKFKKDCKHLPLRVKTYKKPKELILEGSSRSTRPSTAAAPSYSTRSSRPSKPETVFDTILSFFKGIFNVCRANAVEIHDNKKRIKKNSRRLKTMCRAQDIPCSPDSSEVDDAPPEYANPMEEYEESHRAYNEAMGASSSAAHAHRLGVALELPTYGKLWEVCEGWIHLRKETNQSKKEPKLDLCGGLVRIRVERDPALCELLNGDVGTSFVEVSEFRFDEGKRQFVKEIGFAGLFQLPPLTNLNRKFTVWLMRNVDEVSQCILIGEGIDVKEQRSIKVIQEILDRVYPGLMSKIEEDTFKVAFVVFVMSYLLAPCAKHDYATAEHWDTLIDPDEIKLSYGKLKKKEECHQEDQAPRSKNSACGEQTAPCVGNASALQFLERVRDVFRNANAHRTGFHDSLVPAVQRLVASLEKMPHAAFVLEENADRGGSHESSTTSSKVPLLGKSGSRKEKKKSKDKTASPSDCENEQHGTRGVRINMPADEVGGMSLERSAASQARLRRQQPSRSLWMRHVKIIIIVDAVICLVLFAAWLAVCKGFQCVWVMMT
ncbi:hypothetical protein EJB05_10178, partial [Eragrostis curvula]